MQEKVEKVVLNSKIFAVKVEYIIYIIEQSVERQKEV